MKRRLLAYYRLTKPGIVRGNAVHVLAGALLASRLPLNIWPIVAVLVGTSLTIASACVFNNYLDRDIDAKMKRTKKRPSVTGEVSIGEAAGLIIALLLAGMTILGLYTNGRVVAIGIAAYILYVFVYGWAKRTTVHSTLIGAIPGALPAMAGYVAVTEQFSVGAILIFLLVLVWQMPHFYAISVFRRSEYESADLPVLAVVKPYTTVRKYILTYILAYIAVIIAVIYSQTISWPPGILLLAGSVFWLYIFIKTSTADTDKWAKSIFGSSLLLTLVLLLATSLNLFV